MIDGRHLARVAAVHPPARPEAIRSAEAAVGYSFPPEYIELLLCSDGLEPRAGHAERYAVRLFPVDELAEMNAAYEVRDYLPGFVLVGLDGGGRGLLLD